MGKFTTKYIKSLQVESPKEPTIAVITEHYYETRAVNAMMTNKHSDSISVQFIGRLL